MAKAVDMSERIPKTPETDFLRARLHGLLSAAARDAWDGDLPGAWARVEAAKALAESVRDSDVSA